MKEEIKSTLKSMDTEEFIDLAFYRPIGYLWAKLFERLHITPNAVSVASIFLGVAAGVLFYFDDLAYTIPGILLLIWANSFDSADGQLARMTGQLHQTEDHGLTSQQLRAFYLHHFHQHIRVTGMPWDILVVNR